MSERIVIIGLGEGGARVHPVARLLAANLPELPLTDIQDRLERLPWRLPVVPDFGRRERIGDGLRKMGVRFEVQYLEKEKIPASTGRAGSAMTEKSPPVTPLPRLSPTPAAPQPVTPPPAPFMPGATPPPPVIGHPSTFAREKITARDAVKDAARHPRYSRGGIISLSVLLVICLAAFLLITRRINTRQENENFLRHLKTELRHPPAELWMETPDEREARQEYEKAMKAHRLDKRISRLQKAVGLNPYLGEAWRELARCQELQGRADEARRTRERSKENNATRDGLMALGSKFGQITSPLRLARSRWLVELKVPGHGKEPMLNQGYQFYRELRPLAQGRRVTAAVYNDSSEYYLDVPPQAPEVTRDQFDDYLYRD